LSKKTEAVTEDEVEQLWAKGILNSDTPQGLLNAVFFLNGKKIPVCRAARSTGTSSPHNFLERL
jgi:hypothetical protein